MSQIKAIQDQLLTTVAVEYKNDGFIHDKVFPTVRSAQMSGKIPVKGRDFLRLENTVAGGRGRFRSIETKRATTQTFLIETHGLEELVTKADYRNYTLPFNAEKDTTQALTDILKLEKEKTLADALTSASVITQNVTLAGNDQFSAYTTSDPVGVINTGAGVVIGQAGNQFDTAIMDILVFNKIKYHPGFLSALGYTQARPGGLGEDELAKVLGVRKLLVSKARYNTAKEGQAASFAAVWGKDIVFVTSPDSAAVGQISSGYWIVPDDSAPQKVYTYEPGNPPGAKAVLVEDEYDLILAVAASAYLIKAAIA